MGHPNGLEQGFAQGAIDGTVENKNLLTNNCIDLLKSGRDISDLNQKCGNSDLHKFGFPTPDLTGFGQEAVDHSEGLKKIGHFIEGIFGKHDTVEETLTEKVKAGMSPKEKEAYDKEEKQLDEYHRKMMQWGTLMTLNPPPPPEMPKLPMHDEVKERVQKLEKQISDQVRSEMSPADRENLDKQMKDYKERYEDSQRIHNPYGTGEGWRRPPSPPKVVQDYYERIKKAADAVTH